MFDKPFSKLVGLLSAGVTYVAAQNHDVLVNTLDNFMPVVLADPIAHLLLGASILIVYLSHAGNGAGGAKSPNAEKSLTSNMTSR